MHLGVGIDIVDKARIKKIYNKYKEKFLAKILHSSELYAIANFNEDSRVSFLSNRFALKEAISKAIGGGISNQYIVFSDLIIQKNQFGAPFVIKNNRILEAIKVFKKGELETFNINNINPERINILVSVSDEKNISTAIAYIELI
jgi:holo-[acyl-carrier protein] synthase